MSEPPRQFQSWSECDACGFHGLIAYACREDEDYDDPDSLGVMLDATCPACGEEACVLVVREAYEEMLRLAPGQGDRGPED